MTARLLNALLIAIVAVGGAGSASGSAAGAVIVERLYLPMPDGVELAATVSRPSAPGTYPVILNYDPYGVGSFPEVANEPSASFFVPRGYAFMTASVRGTGCSGGYFDQVFSRQEAEDGARLVEWAASREWSSGKVALTGSSYPGINQYFVAAQRPKGLAAIAPFETLGDLYRDVAYPGGIFNAVFADVWTFAGQPNNSSSGPKNDVPKYDLKCAANVAGQAAMYPRGNAGPYFNTHPDDDQFYTTRSPKDVVSLIEVPVFMAGAWQDHEVGSRGVFLYNMLDVPKKLTMLNGLHNDPRQTPIVVDQLGRFFDRWLKNDLSNGIMQEPPVYVLLEVNDATRQPSTVVTSSTWPLDTTDFTSLYLRADGRLSSSAASGSEPADPYAFPGPLNQNKTAHDGIGPYASPSYVTEPFAQDTLFAGPAELELYASTTAPDTDWFVSLSEIASDGSVIYVTKGMLRASHRSLDPDLSLPGRPYHRHTNPTNVEPLGVLAYRVELLPFAHPFRSGSRLRLDFLTPSALAEPYWGYTHSPYPGVNFVHHSLIAPSRLVLPKVEAPALGARGPCEQLAGQPCGLDFSRF